MKTRQDGFARQRVVACMDRSPSGAISWKTSGITNSSGCIDALFPHLSFCCPAFPPSLPPLLLSGCLMAFNCQTLKKHGGEGESPRRHRQGKWQLCSRLLHAPMKTCQHHLGQFAVTIGVVVGGGLIFWLSLVNSIIVFQLDDNIQSERRNEKKMYLLG